MKYRWDKKYLHWGVTAFLVIASCTVFFIALYNIGDILGAIGSALGVLTPVAYGFAFAYLVAPVATFFEKKVYRVIMTKLDERKQKKLLKKNPDYKPVDNIFGIKRRARVFSVLTTVILELLIVAGLMWAVLPQLAETISMLVSEVPGYLKGVTDWVSDILKGFPEIQASVTSVLQDFTNGFGSWLKDTIMPQMSDIVGTVSTGIVGTLSTFYNIFFGFIISIYFLHSKELFAAQGKKMLYSIASPRRGNKILRNLRYVHKTFGGFITGKIIDAAIVGVIFFIIFSIFQFPYALLVSVILGVFNIIPYFGPIIGAVPCALLIFMEDPLYCLYFIIVVAIVQNLDGNVLSPKIIGDSIGLSSFWVIFAILLGQSTFGFIGLIVGIPVFAIIYSYIKTKTAERLEKRGLPIDSNTYRKVGYISTVDNEIITLKSIKENERIAHEQADKADRERKKNKKRGPVYKFFADKLAKLRQLVRRVDDKHEK